MLRRRRIPILSLGPCDIRCASSLCSADDLVPQQCQRTGSLCCDPTACVGALVGEQPLFAMEAAAVAGERAVGADDAMAGHDDADRVRSVGKADGADGAGTADALGKLAVADGFGRGNFAQGSPDFALEGGAGGGGGDVVDGVDVPGEVGWRGVS